VGEAAAHHFLGGTQMRRTALVVGGLLLLGYCGGFLPGTSSEPSGSTEAAASDPAAGDRVDGRPVAGQQGSRQPAASEPPDRQRRGERSPETMSGRRPTRTHAVLDVVDGDTVKVAFRGGEVSVRVIGIDTPETVHPSEPVECGGPQASAAAERLLSGARVRLVFDPSQGRHDSYGRTLAYLRIPGVGDFGTEMIRRGRAAEYTYDTSYAKQARYRAAESRARQAGRGIWNRCGGVDTPQRGQGADRTGPESRPQPLAPQPSGTGCASGYDPCVPPAPPDLDCADVDGPVRITGDDPHGFDADGDGIGCDS
jgi:endonuclease YncB( thermonuclease family)